MYSRSTHITLLARLGGGVVSPGLAEGGVDHEAWRAFHDRYGELIRGFARLRGVQPADCDDLVQEVMLSLSRAIRNGFVYDPSKGTFRSYLKTTVIHAITRRARQNRLTTGLERSMKHRPRLQRPGVVTYWATTQTGGVTVTKRGSSNGVSTTRDWP